jgi:chromosomal replication initiator protein
MQDLINAAADLFDISPHALTNGCRQRHVAHARQAVMYALYQATDMSYAAIGELLGGRDHSTIIHGVAAAERRAIADRDYALKLVALVGRW